MNAEQLKAHNAALKRSARAKRSEEQKAADRAKDAARKREARQCRTEEQKAVDRQRLAAARAAKSDQQKADARARDAERHRVQRTQETPLQREQRLASKQRREAEKRYCVPYEEVLATLNMYKPRWELQYTRAYHAQQAAAAAKQSYQQEQTVAARQAMEQQQAALQSAVAAADAAREALLLSGGSCKPYSDWAKEQQRLEQWRAQWEELQRLEKNADAVLYTWERGLAPADKVPTLVQSAAVYMQELWAFAEKSIQQELQSAQLWLQRDQLAAPVPGATQRLQWQVQQLQRLQLQLQQDDPQSQHHVVTVPAPVGGIAVRTCPMPPVQMPNQQHEELLIKGLRSCCDQVHRLYRLKVVVGSGRQVAQLQQVGQQQQQVEQQQQQQQVGQQQQPPEHVLEQQPAIDEQQQASAFA